jgi:hypothetical protein
MTLLREFASSVGLQPSETDYVGRDIARTRLVLSRSGRDDVERAYRTHWVSPEPSDSRRTKLAERASRPPELVVIAPINDWACHRCGGSGGLLFMEAKGPACLGCAGLAELEFLPSGNAMVTRRAKQKSARYAVVVRFSRTRGRYERLGLLVEPSALPQGLDALKEPPKRPTHGRQRSRGDRSECSTLPGLKNRPLRPGSSPPSL